MEPHEDPVTLVLSRTSHAEVTDEHATAPPDFDLDRYLAHGEPGYRITATPMRVEVRIRREAAVRVIEAPPGADPEVEVVGEEVRLVTTLPDTRPVRAWLLGFGEALVVVAPDHLRQAIAAQVRGAAQRYD